MTQTVCLIRFPEHILCNLKTSVTCFITHILLIGNSSCLVHILHKDWLIIPHFYFLHF